MPGVPPFPTPVFDALINSNMHFDGQTCAFASEGAASNLPLGNTAYTITAWIQPEVCSTENCEACIDQSSGTGLPCVYSSTYTACVSSDIAYCKLPQRGSNPIS